MRYTPSDKYNGLPCSYVGTGCAYENITGELFPLPFPEGLEDNGYLSLFNAIRSDLS